MKKVEPDKLEWMQGTRLIISRVITFFQDFILEGFLMQFIEYFYIFIENSLYSIEI